MTPAGAAAQVTESEANAEKFTTTTAAASKEPTSEMPKRYSSMRNNQQQQQQHHSQYQKQHGPPPHGQRNQWTNNAYQQQQQQHYHHHHQQQQQQPHNHNAPFFAPRSNQKRQAHPAHFHNAAVNTNANVQQQQATTILHDVHAHAYQVDPAYYYHQMASNVGYVYAGNGSQFQHPPQPSAPVSNAALHYNTLNGASHLPASPNATHTNNNSNNFTKAFSRAIPIVDPQSASDINA